MSTGSSEAESTLERAMIQFWAWAEPYMIAYHARRLDEARCVRASSQLSNPLTRSRYCVSVTITVYVPAAKHISNWEGCRSRIAEYGRTGEVHA